MASPTLKEKTARGLLWGGLSNGVQQALNLLFGIFLARMLTPAEYGMVAVLAIFSLIAVALQESGFTSALVNRKGFRHEEYNAVFWFNILMSGGMYAILFLCAPLIAHFYETPELTALARYSFLGFVFSSWGTAQHAYLYKHLMVKQRSIATISAHILSGCIGLWMVYNGYSYWGLATQNLSYIFFVTLIYWALSPWRPTLHIDFAPLKEIIGFSWKMLVTKIFNHINTQVMTIILGKFYTKTETGNYSQAYKWSSMGGLFIVGMSGSVAQPVLAQVAQDKERQKQVFKKMLNFVSFISFPLMLGLGLVAHELILITIKEQWLPCVPMMQLLCISGAFVPITDLHRHLLVSRKRADVYLWNSVVSGILVLLACLVVSPLGIMTMIVVYVCINIAWLTVWQYFVWKEIGLSIIRSFKEIVPFALIAAASMAVTWWITEGMENIYYCIVAKMAVAAVSYIALSWIFKAEMLKECVGYLLHKKVTNA